MPYDVDAALSAGGAYLNKALFPDPSPPPRGQAYQFDPARYMAGYPEFRWLRWTVEAILCYTAYAQSNEQLAPIKSLLGATTMIGVRYLSPVVPNFVSIKWPKSTAIYFAGTQNWAQWIESIIGAVQVSPEPGLPGKVHSVFKGSADAVWSDVVNELFFTDADSQFVLGGHSLGGVVAEYIAQRLLLQKRWLTRRTATFGAPRLGDHVWGSNRVARLYRCVTEGDPVTQLPPAEGAVFSTAVGGVATLLGQVGYEHSLSTRMGVFPNGNTSSCDTDRSGADSVASVAWSQLIGDNPPSPHRLSTYIRYLTTGVRLADQPFVSALHSAYLDLKLAIGDNG